MEYLTVPQVAEELQSNYQKVLYMIKKGKLPAEKEGKAFKIPANYQELMAKIAQQSKEKEPRKKRVSKKAASKGKPGKPGRPKKEKPVVKGERNVVQKPQIEVQPVSQNFLFNNLAKAIQDLVEFQVGVVLGKRK